VIFGVRKLEEVYHVCRKRLYVFVLLKEISFSRSIIIFIDMSHMLCRIVFFIIHPFIIYLSDAKYYIYAKYSICDLLFV